MYKMHHLKRSISSLIAGTLVIFAVAFPTTAAAQDALDAHDAADSSATVYIVPIDGMIDNALARYVERAISDAEAGVAQTIVFHIDTFGGLVDAADAIRKAILRTQIHTVAFIDPNAASAGALISYAADTIVMAPGASIGAATVVEGVGGEAAPDKYQSYMRGLMRATAEANGRDPRIAEAMVDQNLEVEGVSEAGQVLTLSTSEALALGVADFSADDLEDLISHLGLESAPLVYHTATATERVLRFFGSPIMQSILMLMMMGGLYFELQTPGVGFAGMMAAFGAALFFGPHYMLGLVESWEIVLFVVGVVLLLLEIFVIPGFGFAGISGLILIVGSLGVALIPNIGLSFPSGSAISTAIWTLAITLVMGVVLGISFAKFLPNSNRFRTLVLSPELSSTEGYTAAKSHEDLVGSTGRALTPLRPTGTGEFEGQRIDVITSGEFIDVGASIKVVSARGSRIEVRESVRLSDGHETSA